MDAVKGGFVIAEYHYSGHMYGLPDGPYWNLDNANGASIYFPPNWGVVDYNRYVTNALFRFTVDSQWDEFLAEFFALRGLPPEPGEDPGLPPMLIP